MSQKINFLQSLTELQLKSYGSIEVVTLGVDNLIWLARDQYVEEFYTACVSKNLPFCESCLEGKHKTSPFPMQSKRRSLQSLELVHTDVCGKLSVKSLSRAEYFVTFIYDKTRYVWMYISVVIVNNN